jgi:hypothetical protein
MSQRLHWERRGRFLDLCDGDELLASVETRRRRLGPTTYHWLVTGRRTPIAGMTTDLEDAKRTILLYV